MPVDAVSSLKDSHDIIMEKAREIQTANFLNRRPVRKEKTIEAICRGCGRNMEAPWWEKGPTYCWKCSDKYEIGNAREFQDMT